MWLSIWLCALPWDQSCVGAANGAWPEFWCTGCICTLPSVRHEMGTFHTPPHHSGRSRAPCTSLGTFPGPYAMLQLVYSTWGAVIIWGASLETWAFITLGEWKLTEEGSGRHLPLSPAYDSHLFLCLSLGIIQQVLLKLLNISRTVSSTREPRQCGGSRKD